MSVGKGVPFLPARLGWWLFAEPVFLPACCACVSAGLRMVDRASGSGDCSGESGLDERPGGDWRRLSCSKYRSRAAMKPRREYAAKDSEYSRSLFCLSCECAGMSIGYDAAYGEDEEEFVDIALVLWMMVWWEKGDVSKGEIVELPRAWPLI